MFTAEDAENAERCKRGKAITTEIAEKEASIEAAKAELINKEKTLSTRQKTINEFVSKIRHYESEKQIKNEKNETPP